METYSHILSIKIWEFLKKDSLNDIVLVDMIKNEFLEKEQIYNGLKLHWRPKSLTPVEMAFYVGDIVIDSPINDDDLLLKLTQQTISGINRKMHEKKLLTSDQSILFKIMKPLTTRIPSADGAGFINDFKAL
jgi:hypothetical protein